VTTTAALVFPDAPAAAHSPELSVLLAQADYLGLPFAVLAGRGFSRSRPSGGYAKAPPEISRGEALNTKATAMQTSEMRHRASQCRALAVEDVAGRELLLELAETWERLANLKELREGHQQGEQMGD
jgi:hypothetical protein